MKRSNAWNSRNRGNYVQNGTRGPRFNQNNKRKHQEQQNHEGAKRAKMSKCESGISIKVNYNPRNSRPFFDFYRLKKLSESTSNEIATTLHVNMGEFKRFLLDKISPDLLVLTLQVVVKAGHQSDYNIVTGPVLMMNIWSTLLEKLEDYLTKLPFENSTEKLQNKLYHEDKTMFWSNLIEFFTKLIHLHPILNYNIEKLKNTVEKVDKILTAIGANLDNKIKCEFQKIILKNHKDLQTQEKGSVSVSKESCVEENLTEETEDFRSLSIIPTVQDLYDPKPVLKPLKVEGPYESVEEYLDIHFRLLREDVITPLRNGIKKYNLNPEQKNRNNDLRVYNNVILLPPEKHENEIGDLVYFGIKKNIKWHASKRFMFGGLLLLSCDNFKTVLFATVANHDIKNLQEGYVLIEFSRGTVITPNMYNAHFVMLESKIYFEPYSVVLNALKQMHSKNFPMKRYFIHSTTSTQLPRYLDIESHLNYKKFSLPVDKNQPWPTAEAMNLDKSQYQAFKCALTQDFALIQGPPGTGKTFIALQIVRTLLESDCILTGPIVIVCLTNHALDQFLEHILDYTDSIVRIGNRSKNEKLKPYSLMERRKLDPQGYYKSYSEKKREQFMYSKKFELESILKKLQRARLILRYLSTPNIIVPLNVLKRYINDERLKKIKSNQALVEWVTGIKVSQLEKFVVLPQEKENASNNIAEENIEDVDNKYMDDELELDYKLEEDDSLKPTFPLEWLDAAIAHIRQKISQYRKKIIRKSFTIRFDVPEEWENILIYLNNQRLPLEINLAQHSILNKSQSSSTNNNSCWQTYWHWVETSFNSAMLEVKFLLEEHLKKRFQVNDAKQMVDLNTLKRHKIVGVTTAGAARLYTSLHKLRAPIVLVEEAAEILEAHVVCSLTKECQHVILIGDHKQLRPKASVYELGTKYNLNVSLFERMRNVIGNCTQLTNQHRMRPEIAKLITPSIYEKLYNDESVLKYPNVMGLTKNLYFLNHSYSESSSQFDDQSWVNIHEIKFFTAFAKYLIMQGYGATEITILCTYTGQLFAFKDELNRDALVKQVRVTTIDNFQGEENRIILLSLVRNNGEGIIGFLREENRVCVALSRAREGLYIMGNMDDLGAKDSIWSKIQNELNEQNAIGDSLELQCQVHSDQLIRVKKTEDFINCPNGGCLKKCDTDLPCGHFCTNICHVSDREHKLYECKQLCIKSCPNNHPCKLLCYRKCKPCSVTVERVLKCGHTIKLPCSSDPETFPCAVEVDVTLPICNHQVKKLCYISMENCKCTNDCEIRLPCGHKCEGICHAIEDPDHIKYECYKICTKNRQGCENNHPCEKRCFEKCDRCEERVSKTRSCGHTFRRINCYINIENLHCDKLCNRKLSCGHQCQLRCKETCGNCQTKVNKTSSCGHTIEVKCCEEAMPSLCRRPCLKILSCGHPCIARCKDACTSKCRFMVKLSKPGKCGHIFSVPCYLQRTDSESAELLKYCKEPCKTELLCTHICKGTCGECKQGRIHVSCREDCAYPLICGHKCTVPCRDACQPCKRPCEMRCPHSKCNRECGLPCISCKEPCLRKCEHQKCSKFCFELCDIEPCNKACKKTLKCGHPCVGFCGDPCPPLCRVCNKQELTEVFLGNEEDPDARFIFLSDCSHCIESTGLLNWLNLNSETIQVRTCPRCKTPIRQCLRVMNQIKIDLQKVFEVKRKIYYDNNTSFLDEQIEYLRSIKIMLKDENVKEFTEFRSLLEFLLEKGARRKNKREQYLDKQQIEAFRVILEILRQIFKLFKVGKPYINWHCDTSYRFVKDRIVMLIESLPNEWKISQQELNDIQLELGRLYCIIEIINIDYSNGVEKHAEYDNVMATLLGINRFTKETESEIRNKMKNLKVLVKERKMIYKAVGFSQGHWYKCPNGHLYVIGNCGRAMQTSRCNECGAQVGGQRHVLLPDNSSVDNSSGII